MLSGFIFKVMRQPSLERCFSFKIYYACFNIFKLSGQWSINENSNSAPIRDFRAISLPLLKGPHPS